MSDDLAAAVRAYLAWLEGEGDASNFERFMGNMRVAIAEWDAAQVAPEREREEFEGRGVMRGERLFTGYRKIDKGWVAYRCNVAESDANRDTDLVWVANDDVIQNVVAQREAECRTCGAQCEPCATDGREIAAIEREANAPTRQEVESTVETAMACAWEHDGENAKAGKVALLTLFDRARGK